MKNSKKIHFVGIGGIGVSSLARYYLTLGHQVSGSDTNPCLELKEAGASVFVGHKKENLPKEAGLVIYSSAVDNQNEEITEAKRRGIETRSYPEALGDLTRNFYTVAVSGTHGKSTTTAMLSSIMIEGGLDPTVIIGTKLEEFNNTNFRKGKSKYLLIEADEFNAALLNYEPSLAVITNIEEDHLDYYRDLNHILETFTIYIRDNLQKGKLVLNIDDENSKKLIDVGNSKKIKYSLVSEDTKEIRISLPGEHNRYNALAAFTAGKELGIAEESILKGLLQFKGSWRRFEEKDVVLKNGMPVKIIRDYAHHPTEIKATLEALNEKYKNKKVTVLFQPHQYERSYRLFEKFIEVFALAEDYKLLLTDIYTVEGRESEEIKKKVSAKMMGEKVKKAEYVGDLKEAEDYILKNLQKNEILVIMGAGDVYNLEDCITKRSN